MGGTRMTPLPDKSLFYRAALEAMDAERGRGGIGTLGERTLHAAIKNYLEPDPARREVRVGRFVADILNDGGIFEIQTRQFYKMRAKLASFLPEHRVTIVYPVAQKKSIVWINSRTGETQPERRSPKTGRPQDIFAELCHIRPCLCDPNLRLLVLMLEVRETRCFDGIVRGRRKNPRRTERYPTELCSVLPIEGPAGYLKLIPESLGEPFTSRGYAEACGIPLGLAQTALTLLNERGAVVRVGKTGNSYLYRRMDALLSPAQP